MRLSPARLAANRANAARSTGPRTAHGKASSSRNALTHGAYASDDTLLALSSDNAPRRPNAAISTNESAVPADPPGFIRPSLPSRINPEAAFTPVADSNMPVGGSYLATLTEQYRPVGPTETILVRRLAALALRLERLNDAIAALPSLGERRALVDHLVERYAIGESVGQFRNQPEWSGALRRYDDPSYVNPLPDQIRDDPALDPDPALCATVYTLSSRRAETFSRLEAAAGRAFAATLTQLRAEQTARRRAESYPPLEYTPRRDLLNAVDTQVRSTLAAYGLDPNHPSPSNLPAPPAPEPAPAGHYTPIDRNEPTANIPAPHPHAANASTPHRHSTTHAGATPPDPPPAASGCVPAPTPAPETSSSHAGRGDPEREHAAPPDQPGCSRPSVRPLEQPLMRSATVPSRIDPGAPASRCDSVSCLQTRTPMYAERRL